MAIVDVVEKVASRSGTRGVKGDRTYTRVFTVTSDDADDGPKLVRQAAGSTTSIPTMYSSYTCGNESDTGCFVSSKRADLVAEGEYFVWEVTVDYTVFRNDEHKHPLERRPKISLSFEHFEKVFEIDLDGTAVLNSAGQFFDPPPAGDDSRPVLTITRNEAARPSAHAILYQDAVNSDSYSGAEPGQCKIFAITATEQYESLEDSDDEFSFWEVTYEIHYKREGWPVELLDQGRYKKSGSGGGQLAKIKDDEDDLVADPVLLDGAGNPLPEGGTAVYLPFTFYKVLPYSALGLPA